MDILGIYVLRHGDLHIGEVPEALDAMGHQLTGKFHRTLARDAKYRHGGVMLRYVVVQLVHGAHGHAVDLVADQGGGDVERGVQMEAHLGKVEVLQQRMTQMAGGRNRLSVAAATAHAACTTAQEIGADAILTVSQRGTTARLVSRFHPGTPIIACLLDQQVRRQMALYWGVEPIMMPYASSTDELVDFAVQAAAQAGVVHEGDLVVVTAGVPVGVAGTTNMIRIQQVGGALVNAVGIGEKKASGPLCICRSTDEVAEKFQPGDVLVVPYTTNELLPYIRQAAAVITEEASVECHTATIGLALDKPVIVGAAGAVQRLTDGTMVTVDCARGLVRAMP